MTVIPITCDNCGAKYRLPETFTGKQAKCQKCGSVIDVAKQRGAAEAPAAAKPAAAKPAAAKPAAARPAAARPAVDRSKTELSSEAPKPSARPARSERAAKGSAKAGGDGDDKPTRGRGDRGKKNNTMVLAASGIGLVAIVVVVVIMMNSGKKPDASNTAKVEPKANVEATTPPAPKDTTPTAPADTPADKPADKPAPKPAKKPAKQPAKQPAKAAAQKPDEAAPTEDKPAAPPPVQPAEASTPPAPEDPNHVKRPWEKLRNAPQSMDQVTDAKSYPEVQWPAEIDDATKKEIQKLAEDATTDGLPSQRAKNKLEKIGYGAMFGIVERLRLLDYKDANQSMVAFDLNKLLGVITGDLNARFEPVEATETIVPAKAEWNTRSVKGWLGLLEKYPTSDAFKKDKAERLKKQAEADK